MALLVPHSYGSSTTTTTEVDKLTKENGSQIQATKTKFFFLVKEIYKGDRFCNDYIRKYLIFLQYIKKWINTMETTSLQEDGKES